MWVAREQIFVCRLVEHWGKFDPTRASISHGEEVDVLLSLVVSFWNLIVYGPGCEWDMSIVIFFHNFVVLAFFTVFDSFF